MRKIFISPYNIGYLSAFQSLEKIDLFKIYTPDIRFNTFLYSSLFQTGADFIEIIEDHSNLLSRSTDIKRRIINSDQKSYIKLFETTRSIFSKFTKDDYEKDKKLLTALRYAEVLLTDLLFSFRRGSDLLFMGEIPDLSPFKTAMHPDLYSLLTNFLSGITSGNLFVSAPISIIQKSEVSKFNEIIKSDIYRDYSDCHNLLSLKGLNSISSSLKNKSEKLIAANPMLLSMYNNITSFVPLVKFVDPRLGELAKIASNSITKLTDENSRQSIVIYMYRDVALSRLKMQVDLSMNRFEKDFLKWAKEGIREASRQGVNKHKLLSFLEAYMTEKKNKKLGR